MAYGIFVICVAGAAGSPINAWVMDFDVNANNGRGGTAFTRLPHRAMSWPSMADALRAYHTQSKVQPLRDDGKPNRPMSAFTAEIRVIK